MEDRHAGKDHPGSGIHGHGEKYLMGVVTVFMPKWELYGSFRRNAAPSP